MPMSQEAQKVELINPEISKIKVGAGLGIILLSSILYIQSVVLAEYRRPFEIQPIEIILRLLFHILTLFGGLLIAYGLGAPQYRGQWLKKRNQK
jgi:hypothetical protein